METSPKHLFDRLLLTDELSPIPGVHSWGLMLVSSDKPDEIVEIGQNEIVFGNAGGMPQITNEVTWRAQRSAVVDSYAEEFIRVLYYVRALAKEVRIVTPHPPELSLRGVDFSAQPTDDDARSLSATSRLARLIAEAVRMSGKPANPTGSRVLDIEYWLGIADRYFSRLGTGEEHLAVSRVFIPALTEWLRASAVAAGIRRRMIRARIGMPANQQVFLATAARLSSEVAEVAARLGLAFAGTSLAAYREGAHTVLEFQAAYPREPGGIALDLVFSEHDSGDAFDVPAIGLTIPAPPDGYPLKVEDGSIEMLPRPPWQMGMIVR
jgi:hypothetical protein